MHSRPYITVKSNDACPLFEKLKSRFKLLTRGSPISDYKGCPLCISRYERLTLFIDEDKLFSNNSLRE